MYVYIQHDACTYVHIYTHMYHARMCMYIHIYSVHIYIYTLIHTYCIYLHLHLCVYIYIYSAMYIYVYIYTYIYIYTHMHTYTLLIYKLPVSGPPLHRGHGPWKAALGRGRIVYYITVRCSIVQYNIVLYTIVYHIPRIVWHSTL